MTVIICPACNTRFETAAVIPPTGRKVRCSKCGNVWQAMAVIEPAKPTVVSAPTPPPVQPRPTPAAPMPPRRAPEPRPAAAPRPAPPEPRPGSTGLGNAMGRFPSQQGFAPKPTNGVHPNDRPPPPPKPTGPLFSTEDEMQPDVRGDGAGLTAGMGANSRAGAEAEDLGSYNAGALINPDAGLATNVPIAEGRERKLPPAVAIGWGVLALLLAMLAAFVALSPKTVVSVLPGAAKLYDMMGKPVNVGLKIENVHSSWSDAGGQRVLQVDGDIVNPTASEVSVPTVVVALQDNSGKELTQATASVLSLAAGAKTSFTLQIPGAPENVSSLKVSFAKPK
ncbi:MAG TPA: zinc-ribbon domain-containing protein [Methyloceanibacter sp.]|nr:zinc-ribbon domain-containing protein [Methyloceanibacter sp.]